MSAPVKPAEVRQARAYLQQQGITSARISPPAFVAASHELGKTFKATLTYLAFLLSGGSGEGASPITTAGDDRLDPMRAIGKPGPDEEMAYDQASPASS